MGPRRSKQSSREHPEVVKFSDLRADWYRSNSAMPRYVRQSAEGTRSREFHGFPRQWIPVFEWFRVQWAASIQPASYIPFFSDLSERELMRIVDEARRQGCLRTLVESSSMYDSVVSDLLYIVDNTLPSSKSAALPDDNTASPKSPVSDQRSQLLLNGWQSYGRPEVKALDAAMETVRTTKPIAVMLPCSLTRPYDRSRTHKRIYQKLEEAGYQVPDVHRVVVSSLGVIPEELWSTSQVSNYDAGVPDIYRLLRLLRLFFSKNHFEEVVDCLQFEPYTDLLRIVALEGFIPTPIRLKSGRNRGFHIRRPMKPRFAG
jgi:hypothetical protein